MDVYNKLFTKILDSSIWLEPTTTRIVWMTFIASMDEDGFVAFAAPGNVAGRARVTIEEAIAALEALEGPDPNSSDPDNDGRRIERVQGGWMVLNAGKYRAITTRIIEKEQTRQRVARHRAKKKAVTNCNAEVTHANVPVTTSESEAETEASVHTPSKSVEVERPSLKEVLFAAEKMGLAAWKAEDWFNEMEGCNWRDYNSRPIVKWLPVLTRICRKWEADGRPKGPRSYANDGKSSQQSTDRNKGTLNEGGSAQYRRSSQVGGVQAGRTTTDSPAA